MKFNGYFLKAEILSGLRNQVAPAQEQTIILTEKVKTYLLMISSTYFIELNSGFKQNSEKLLKIKESVTKRKAQRFKSKLVRQASNSPLIVTPKSIQDLKKDKEDLDKRLSPLKKLENKPFQFGGIKENLSLIPTGRELLKGNANTNLNTVENNLSLQHELEIREDLKIKACLSEGNSIFTNEAVEKSQDDEDKGLCYVCFGSEANAVMMDCGHGGVCYECATEFLLKKRECMECRRKVNRVIKISLKPQLKNIVISHELGKLVSERVTQNQHI